MGYYDAKEERKNIFYDTKKLYESNERLMECIKNTKNQQKVVKESDDIVTLDFEQKSDTPAQIVVSNKRSLEAAKGYVGHKVCVLNFASATNPGGGVEKGSNAQEESICRCSTLYPCIFDKDVTSQFHDRHKKELQKGIMNVFYNDDCIYTPGVTVFKTDTALPKLMPEKDWYQIDVISCAAPNLRRNAKNTMGSAPRKCNVSIKASELLNLHMKRVRRILDIAKMNSVEVMILGAFGCGAFENSPEVVAEAMARIIKDYLYDFKFLEFAVYCPPKDTRNYDVFKRRLSRKI